MLRKDTSARALNLLPELANPAGRSASLSALDLTTGAADHGTDQLANIVIRDGVVCGCIPSSTKTDKGGYPLDSGTYKM